MLKSKICFGFSATGKFIRIVTDHVVEFDSCDAKAINVPLVQNVMDSDFAERPVNPKREGYTFMGWYTDKKYSHKQKYLQ